jgi:PAS domain S-box-containing protein
MAKPDDKPKKTSTEPADLRRRNAQLEAALAEAGRRSAALEQTIDELKALLEDRTTELIRTSHELEEESSGRIRTKAELTRTENRYRTLVEKSPLGIMCCDSNGIITQVNDEMLNILGLDSADHIRDASALTFGPLAKAGFSEVIGRCIESGESSVADLILAGRGRNEINARLHAAPIRDEDGHITGVQAVVENITQLKRAESLLLRSERLKALGEMARDVASSFNALLQDVERTAREALDCVDSRSFFEVRPHLERILERTRQTGVTVRRLQKFAPARHEAFSTPKRIFDLTDLVKESVDMGRLWLRQGPDMDRSDVSIELDLAWGCRVRGQEPELTEVVLNLLKNAVEALPRGGTITVKTYIEDDQVVLRVQDDGAGIPKKDMDRVFQPYWTTKEGRSGMGLAATFGIVRRHGGIVTVKSKEGHGTQFTVKLPFVPRPARIEGDGGP